MNTVSPIFYACAEGSLANATLCAAKRDETPVVGDADAFETDAQAKAPCASLVRPRWRQVVDAVLSPISGPKLTIR